MKRLFAYAFWVILASVASTGESANLNWSASLKWAASWAAPMQGAFAGFTAPVASVSAYEPQPDLTFALPNATATNQTFRTIVKPDILGQTVRIRLSNVFGTQAVTFSAASIALQAYQANIVPGTNTPVTFGGATSVVVPAGSSTFSDPVILAFVSPLSNLPQTGANLAVSFAVSGSTSSASFHMDAFTTNYISAPNSGNVTAALNDTSFPYSTTSTFFLSELDVLAPSNTKVVVAFGDSITDGTFSTLNGNDRWLNVMSQQLHNRLGAYVSVVNAGISGNAVLAQVQGPSAISRVSRDVIGLSGVNTVVWLEGINDLGLLGVNAAQVEGGYQLVVGALHAAGIKVIGATLTPSMGPGGQPPANSPLLAALGPAAANYASTETNAIRQQINTFIITGGLFDGTADFATAVTDPNTGTLKAAFVPNSEGSAGDFLHLNRAGYQALGPVAASAVLALK
jgi:lysophospholipase L1-like esterase